MEAAETRVHKREIVKLFSSLAHIVGEICLVSEQVAQDRQAPLALSCRRIRSDQYSLLSNVNKSVYFRRT